MLYTLCSSRVRSLFQDPDPNYFGLGLILMTHTHVIIHVILIVEPNQATVIRAEPVLRVDTNQHQIEDQNWSRWSLDNPFKLSCPNICWQITVLLSDSMIDWVTSSQHCWFVLYILLLFKDYYYLLFVYIIGYRPCCFCIYPVRLYQVQVRIVTCCRLSRRSQRMLARRARSVVIRLRLNIRRWKLSCCRLLCLLQC
jgi:hypothetical protein